MTIQRTITHGCDGDSDEIYALGNAPAKVRIVIPNTYSIKEANA